MPTIPRHFYYKTDDHPNEPSCLVCGFVLAIGTDYNDHLSFVDTKYREGSNFCHAEDLEAWKAYRKAWWNTSRASQPPVR
jgi:hypothetical protein